MTSGSCFSCIDCWRNSSTVKSDMTTEFAKRNTTTLPQSSSLSTSLSDEYHSENSRWILCFDCVGFALASSAGPISQIAASFEVSEIRVSRGREIQFKSIDLLEHLCLLSPWISETDDISHHGRVRLVSFIEVMALRFLFEALLFLGNHWIESSKMRRKRLDYRSRMLHRTILFFLQSLRLLLWRRNRPRRVQEVA